MSDPQPSSAVVSGAHLLILTSLVSVDRHGHALMKDIQQFAGVRLGPGTLYKAIGRLEELGYIEALSADDRRRPYRITPLGSTVLERSLAELGRVVDEARGRLGLLGRAGVKEAVL